MPKFRWLDPISLPLYTILFDNDPFGRASSIAAQMAADRPPEQMARIAGDIERELRHPTQNVREILNNPQSEAECRAFLAAFAACVRQDLETRMTPEAASEMIANPRIGEPGGRR